ncbi:zinc ribbon domain-containing protein [Pseudalkalibacillus sp. A8]
MSERIYRCECGLNLDRDYNSALNIKKEGMCLLATA